MGFPEEPAGLDDARTVRRNYPALSHLQFSTRIRTGHYRRTRHLTGSMSSTPPNNTREHTPYAASATHDQSAHSHVYGRYDSDGAASKSPNIDSSRPAQPASSFSGFAGTDHARAARTAEPGPDGLRGMRAVSRYAFMLAIFVVGTAVGLGTSWWLRHSAGPAQPSVVKSVSPSLPAQVAVPPEANRAVTVRGISPSELPYDGKPPSDEEGDSNAELATAVQRQNALPEARLSVKRPSSHIDQSSGQSVEGTADIQELGREPPAGRRAKNKAEADIPRNKEQGVTAPAREARQTPKEMQRPQATANEREDGNATNAASKKRAPAKLAKDREIDRIKQEADKELQRKFEVGRSREEARTRRQLAASLANKRYADQVVESKTAHVRKVLAKCERISNLFRREKCKWDLCSNRWGKHGCPSYSRPVSSY